MAIQNILVSGTTVNRLVFIVAAMVLVLAACTPEAESTPGVARTNVISAGDHSQIHVAQESGNSDVTAEKIETDIVGWVVKISESTGMGSETDWTFDADEYRKANILEKRTTEKGMVLIVYMLTRDNPKPEDESVLVSGKLQIEYEKHGDQWILKSVENQSFYYSVGQPI